MKTVNNFDVLRRMSERNLDIRMAPLDNIVDAQMVKAGTEITIGVAGDVVNAIARGKFVGGLIMADKTEFDQLKQEMAEEVE